MRHAKQLNCHRFYYHYLCTKILFESKMDYWHFWWMKMNKKTHTHTYQSNLLNAMRNCFHWYWIFINITIYILFLILCICFASSSLFIHYWHIWLRIRQLLHCCLSFQCHFMELSDIESEWCIVCIYAMCIMNYVLLLLLLLFLFPQISFTLFNQKHLFGTFI